MNRTSSVFNRRSLHFCKPWRPWTQDQLSLTTTPGTIMEQVMTCFRLQIETGMRPLPLHSGVRPLPSVVCYSTFGPAHYLTIVIGPLRDLEPDIYRVLGSCPLYPWITGLDTWVSLSTNGVYALRIEKAFMREASCYVLSNTYQ